MALVILFFAGIIKKRNIVPLLPYTPYWVLLETADHHKCTEHHLFCSELRPGHQWSILSCKTVH